MRWGVARGGGRPGRSGEAAVRASRSSAKSFSPVSPRPQAQKMVVVVNLFRKLPAQNRSHKKCLPHASHTHSHTLCHGHGDGRPGHRPYHHPALAPRPRRLPRRPQAGQRRRRWLPRRAPCRGDQLVCVAVASAPQAVRSRAVLGPPSRGACLARQIAWLRLLGGIRGAPPRWGQGEAFFFTPRKGSLRQNIP